MCVSLDVSSPNPMRVTVLLVVVITYQALLSALGAALRDGHLCTYLPLLETGRLVEEYEIGLLGWDGGLLYGDQPDTGARLSI